MRYAFGLMALLAFSVNVQADQWRFQMQDGSVLVGQLQSFSNGHYAVLNPTLGRLMIPESKINRAERLSPSGGGANHSAASQSPRIARQAPYPQVRYPYANYPLSRYPLTRYGYSGPSIGANQQAGSTTQAAREPLLDEAANQALSTRALNTEASGPQASYPGIPSAPPSNKISDSVKFGRQSVTAQIMNNPQALSRVASLRNNANVQRIMSDPKTMSLIQQGDYQALLEDANVQQLLRDPAMQGILSGVR